jgi:O-acetyl-ADP-ribose deacetylase (regulator of RNase III)
MINETTRKLFEAKAEALVNAVNCVGVMDKGIALQFKQKFRISHRNSLFEKANWQSEAFRFVKRFTRLR